MREEDSSSFTLLKEITFVNKKPPFSERERERVNSEVNREPTLLCQTSEGNRGVRRGGEAVKIQEILLQE